MSLQNQLNQLILHFQETPLEPLDYKGKLFNGIVAKLQDSSTSFLCSVIFNTVNQLTGFPLSEYRICQFKISSKKLYILSPDLQEKGALKFRLAWDILAQNIETYLTHIADYWCKKKISSCNVSNLNVPMFFYALTQSSNLSFLSPTPAKFLPVTCLLLKNCLNSITPYKVIRLASSLFYADILDTLWPNKPGKEQSCIHTTQVLGHILFHPQIAAVHRLVLANSSSSTILLENKRFELLDLAKGKSISIAAYKSTFDFGKILSISSEIESKISLPIEAKQIDEIDFNIKCFELFEELILTDYINLAPNTNVIYQVFIKTNHLSFFHTFTIEILKEKPEIFFRIYQSCNGDYTLEKYFDEIVADSDGLKTLDQFKVFLNDLKKLVCTSILPIDQGSVRRDLIEKCFFVKNAPSINKLIDVDQSRNPPRVMGLNFFFFTQEIESTHPLFHLANLIDSSIHRQKILEKIRNKTLKNQVE